jgi:hypothetical protein
MSATLVAPERETEFHVRVYDGPKVHLLSNQVFHNPLSGQWGTDAPSDGEAIAEFAGRLCYMSSAATRPSTGARATVSTWRTLRSRPTAR